MKREEIDDILDSMAAEATAKGDETLLPAVISYSQETWLRGHPPVTCTRVSDGIRYRGVQVLVARDREDKVLNRAEDNGEGAPYFDLEPRA